MAKKTGNAELAELMYQAVRTGGSLISLHGIDGGGWPLGQGYKPLTRRKAFGGENYANIRKELNELKSYNFRQK